ncbi:MAG: O-sialoglycoprotein endopeptidase, partial [Nanoarchaeota archaeon]|nr:O-sialoglycoprotein endopeptidase [Nanoarchaeota archaeon]
MKMISVGAESKVFLNGNEIVKDRIKKGYRIDELDKKLRTSRTKLEFKILNKCYSLGIRVPRPIKIS